MALTMTLPSTDACAEAIKLLAAGSLKAALTEACRAFEAANGNTVKVEPQFGASGLLRMRIECGQPAHIFASADTGNPKRVLDRGMARSGVNVFARNRLCALVRGGLAVSPDTLLDVMLTDEVKLGTSTPDADPSGDYAMALFSKADAIRPGAKAALEAKALRLTGGPNSPKARAGASLYGWVISSGQADVFLTYATSAAAAKLENSDLQIVELPMALTVRAEYGLVVLNGAPAKTHELARFVLGEKGQAILGKWGFEHGDDAGE